MSKQSSRGFKESYGTPRGPQASKPQKAQGQPYYPQPSAFLDPTKLALKPFCPRNETQTRILAAIEANVITFLIGPAGTGKSFLGVAAGIEYLCAGVVERLILARPAIEAGDSIGFLPGDKDEKIDPYIRPMVDAASYFIGREALSILRKQETVEASPMSFLRGRTFSDCFMVLDEMQNATPAQLKLALTRIGENTKAVVTLDPSQCDLPAMIESASEDLERFKGKPAIAIIHFDIKDVVRSQVVKTLLKAYQE